jgi:adenylate cyclase
LIVDWLSPGEDWWGRRAALPFEARPGGEAMLSGEAVSRRLAAVLVADYSPLMDADEEGTLAPLKGLRRGLIDPKIARREGRAVKAAGDGALVELASAVEAAPIAAG